MNDALRNELAKPGKLTLDGQQYPFAFPMGAILAYKEKTGDNLFQLENWKKINPAEDPERFLYCLWAGLHRYDQEEHKLVPALSVDAIAAVVDFANVKDLAQAIGDTLNSYFPKAVESADPNAAKAESPAA